MSAVTDPAAELGLLLETLVTGSQEKGSTYLASKFKVEPWSLDFYQILFMIIQRVEFVRVLLRTLPGFEHLTDEMDHHLNDLKSGFTDHAMRNGWHSVGANHVNRQNIQPLKMCSAFMRQHISYPQLTLEEQEEVLAEADLLLKWLKEHQLEESDFIRQALIEGLEQFIFRMRRLEWLGWGYSVESLKAVVMAYIALERGDASSADAPIAAAAVKVLGKGLKKVFATVGVSKDIYERADFALRAYGALSLAWHAHGGIAGLLADS